LLWHHRGSAIHSMLILFVIFKSVKLGWVAQAERHATLTKN